MRRKSNPALAVVALTVTLAACGPQIAAPGAINNLPASVALEPIQVGATASSTIAFTNGGGSSLSYAVSSDVAWLTASPSSATVPANTATSLTVNVTCPVVPGPYTANVTITSQNPNLSKTVPVTVTCAPEANTEANRPVLQLGNIATSVTTPSITVTGTVGDNVALQSLKVNGATVTVGTGGAFTYTVNNLTPGNNVITVVATDTSGLQTTRTATVVYTPASTDTQAPLVSNVALTNTATTGSVQGSVTATDNVAVTTLAYTVTPAAGGAAVKTGAVTVSTPGSTINQAFTIDLSSLADGTYKIAFTASDGTNTSAAKESASFIVDKTGPTFTPIYISPVTASTASVTLGNLQDALSNVSSTVSYTLNGAAAQTATLSNNAFTITGLQEGTNSITITAKDALGNATTKPIQIVFTAVTPPPPPGPGDTQAPVITSFGYNNATTGVFQGFVTATDNVAVTGLSYTVAPSAGGAVVKSGTVPVQTPGTSIDQTFSLDLSSLADGSYKITFTASDGVNTSAPFTSAAFTLDKTGPTFTPSAAASVNVNSVNVTLNGLQDALSTVSSSVTYKINGGVTQTATLSGNAFTAMNLQSGVNSIAITVKDSLGNATTKTIQVTYDMTDTQAPVVTNVSLGSTATTGTLQGSVTATDNVAVTGLSYTVAPSAGGAVVASGTLSITAGTSVTKAFSLDLSSLADGSYKVTFTASDGTSTSAPSTSTAFTLDKTGPTFTPSAAASVNVNSVNVTLNGLQDALSTVSSSVTYKINGGATQTATLSGNAFTATNLQSGVNSIAITAKDALGNASTQTVEVTYTPVPAGDTQAPVVTNVSLGSTATTGTLQGSVTATDNVAVTSLSYTVAPTAGGAVVQSGSVTVTTPGTDITKAFSLDLSSLADGRYKITFTASDGTNTSAPSTSTAFTLDKTGPNFTPSAAVSVNVNSVNVTLNGLQDALSSVNSTVSYTVNGGSAQTATLSGNAFTAMNLQSGVNSIAITVSDSLGNTSTQTVQVTYNAPDTQAPVVTNVSLGSTATTGTLQGSVTATDNVAVTSLSYTVAPTAGGAVVQSGSVTVTTPGTDITKAFSLDLSSLADGSYKITFTASDGTNTSAPSTSAAFTLDKTGPNFTPSAAVSVNVNSVNVTLNGLQDALSSVNSTVSYTVNGGSAQTATLSGNVFTAMNLQSGVNSIAITVSDSLGNTSTQTVQVTYNAPDTQAPVVTNVSLGSTATTGTLQGSVTATDNVAVTSLSYTVAPSAGGASVLSGTLSITAGASVSELFSLDLSSLADGSYKIAFTASDGTSTSAPFTSAAFTLDKTGPTFTPSATSPVGTSSTTVTLNGLQDALSSVNSTVSYTVNGGSAQAATLSSNAFTVTNLQEGANSVAITVSDSLGNTSTQTIQITSDTQLPNLSVTPIAAYVSSPDLNITGTATDSGTGIAFVTATPDGDTTQTITTTVDGNGNFTLTLLDLAEGAHSIVVTTTDIFGRTSDPQTITTFVDATPPTLTNIASSISSNNVTVTGTASDIAGSGVDHVTYSVTKDGAPFITATNVTVDSAGFFSIPLTGLANGSYVVTLAAVDLSGNSSTASTVSVNVQTGAPSVLINSIATSAGSGTITGTISDNNSPLTATSYQITDASSTVVRSGTLTSTNPFSISYSGLAVGTYTFTVSATNALGTTSQSSTFVVDQTPPTVTLVSSTFVKNGVNARGRFVVQATDANGVASVQYRLLGASTWTNATSIGNNRYSFSARIKNATSVTVEVRATDTAGNVSVPVTFTAP